MDQMKRDSLLAAAKQLCDLKYHWNVVDVYELTIQDARGDGSPYHHITKALEQILKHLGVTDLSTSAFTFYDLVTQEETPVEALAAVHAREAERAD